MYDPTVYLGRAAFMQRLMDYVVRGYHYHVSGVIPLGKAGRLASKFADRYKVDSNVNQRSYARRKGRARSALVLRYNSKTTSVYWFLMATDGEGEIHRQESLLDARERHARLLVDDFELVRLTKARQKGGGITWTWRLTSQSFSDWRRRAIEAARSPYRQDGKQYVFQLQKLPGFSGVRDQAYSLLKIFKKEWRRRHAAGNPPPEVNAIPVIRRISGDKKSLSELTMLCR